MKKTLKYFLPILCMIAALAALTLAVAAATETGSCGTDLTYTFDTETGVLTISGTGAMTDFYRDTPAPWSSYAADVRTAVLEEGVTTLGNSALLNCSSLESLSLPTTLTRIGAGSLPSESPLRNSVMKGEICVDGWLMDYNGTVPKDLCLSEGICGMADAIFIWNSVETAVLPRSLRYIGGYAFAYSNKLTDVTILNPDCMFTHAAGALPFPQSTTVHGYKGSTAEAYASTYGNPFAALEPAVGDADGDGNCTIHDALLTTQALLDGKFDAVMDMDGDGKLSLADVILLLRAVR